MPPPPFDNPVLPPCELYALGCESLPPPPEEEALPDLKIVGIEYIDGIGLEIRVENVGSSSVTSDFDIDIFFNLSTAPLGGDFSEYYVTHTPIGPGEMATVSMEIPTEFFGSSMNVSALVDSPGVIDESNDGNNHWFNCSEIILDSPLI